MVYYGMFKILLIQFGEIAFWRLLQPYGDSSPMGLAWTFWGHSKGYNIFMVLSEFIGGVLLFHRKTKLMGSLILIIFNKTIESIQYQPPFKLKK